MGFDMLDGLRGMGEGEAKAGIGQRAEPEFLVNSVEERSDEDFWLRLAWQQAQANDFATALETLKTAEAFGVDGVLVAGRRLAVLERQMGVLETAVKSLPLPERSISAEEWFRRGYEQWMVGDWVGSIASYDKAIEFKPDFHEAWNNRGLSLSALGRMEEAIASYDKAIEFKPDLHEAWYARGNSLSALGRREEAIASYDKAIEFKPDDHEAWANRGFAVKGLKYLSPASSIRISQAPKTPASLRFNNPDLDQGGFAGQRASLNEGLRQCPAPTYGHGFLQQQLGNAYWEQAKQSENLRTTPRDHWRDALAPYNAALKIFTETAHPTDRLKTLQSLINTHLALRTPGHDEPILALLRQGTALRQRLLDAATTEDQRNRLNRTLPNFNQLTVDLLIRQGKTLQALETAEQDKNALMTWLLAETQANAPSPNTPQLQLQPHQAILYWHQSPNALTTFLLLPSPAATGTEGEIDLQTLHSPDAQTALGQITELEGWLSKWNAAYAEHLDKSKTAGETAGETARQAARQAIRQAAEPTTKPTANSQTNGGSSLPGDGNQEQSDWYNALPEQLDALARILQITRLKAQLPPEITHLTLVPHRDLHRLPLHAFFLEHQTTVLPSVRLGQSLRPSDLGQADSQENDQANSRENDQADSQTNNQANSQINSQINSPTNSPTNSRTNGGSSLPHALMITAPDHDHEDKDKNSGVLHHAEAETHLIQQSLNTTYTVQILPEAETKATKEQEEARVSDALGQPHQIFHFNGHAFHYCDDPKKSALALAGRARLTVQDLRQISLRSYSLVTLAGCETALAGNQTITAEYVGLTSALLAQGIPHVLSTLWSVESAASMVFMVEFYSQLQLGPLAALHHSRQTLRTLTVAQLKTRYDRWLTLDLPTKVREFLGEERDDLDMMEPTQIRYEHPYYWAAFTLTGLGT